MHGFKTYFGTASLAIFILSFGFWAPLAATTSNGDSYSIDGVFDGGSISTASVGSTYAVGDRAMGTVLINASGSRYTSSSGTYLLTQGFTQSTMFSEGLSFLTAVTPLEDGATQVVGTAPAGELINVYDHPSNTLLGSSTAQSDSTYIVNLSGGLSSGQVVYVQGTYSHLQTSAITVQGGSVGTVVDGPKINAPITQESSVIKGFAIPGTTVEVFNTASGKKLGEALSDSVGQWELTLASSSGLAVSENAVLTTNQTLMAKANAQSSAPVVVSDIGGNGGSLGATLRANISTGDTTVYGTAPPNSSVKVVDTRNGTIVGLAFANASGIFQASLSSPITANQKLVAISSGRASGLYSIAGASTAPSIRQSSSKPVVVGQTLITGAAPSDQKTLIYDPALQRFLGYGYAADNGDFEVTLGSKLTVGSIVVPVVDGLSGPPITVTSVTEPSISGRPINFPNPFNPNVESTTIEYNLSLASDIEIWIFDINGEVVKKIDKSQSENGGLATAVNRVPWDGKNAWGEGCSNGVYLYRIIEKTVGQKVIGKGKIAILRQ